MKTLTPENAETRDEIAALIYAHKTDDFRDFMAFVDEILMRYLAANEGAANK